MKALVTLAAARPVVALALGYAPFLLLLAAAVVVQSGSGAAMTVVALDAALMLAPIGCVALAGRFLGTGTGWWIDRLVAVAVGLVGLFVVVFGATFVLDVPDPGLGLPVWLVVPGLAAGVNLPPLVLGVGIEGLARRLAPRLAPAV
jgi:hypothetical protein